MARNVLTMIHRVRPLVVLLAFVWAWSPVAAQNMPDPSQIAGRPLDAPELPDGTVTVRVVRERMGNNVADQPVTIRGGGVEKTVRTDAQGRATFEGLPTGTTVHAETLVGDEILTSDEFAVPARGGMRIALIAGIAEAQARERAAAEEAAKAPPRPGIVTFGGESRIILEFQDDELQVFYLLDIVNAARTPIDIGAPMVLQLPDAAAGAGALEGSSPLASINGDRVSIRGPFPPGTTSVQFGYRMPWTGDSVRIAQQWPAAMERLFVAIQKVGQVALQSPQLTAQQEARAGNTPFIMATGGRLNAGETLTLDISGLPNRSTTLRNVALTVAALILLVGAGAAWRGSPERAERQAALDARREALFRDLEALERQRATLAPERYEARRQSLVAQLERLLAEIDRDTAVAAPSVANRGRGTPAASEGAAR